MQRKIGLSVDWDYFVVSPEGNPANSVEKILLYDWGHSEHHAAFQEQVWKIRYADLVRRNEPVLTTSGEEADFWDRFEFTDDVRVYVADSHVFAYEVFAQTDPCLDIWNFDSHHDFGYSPEPVEKGDIDCGSWALGVTMTNGTAMHVRYPKWKTWAFDVEKVTAKTSGVFRRLCDRQFDSDDNLPDGPIEVVYICRSGAWTPPWLDEEFFSLLHSAPAIPQMVRPFEPRPFDEREMDALIDEISRQTLALAVEMSKG